MEPNPVVFEGFFDAAKAQRITGSGIKYINSVVFKLGGVQNARKQKIKNIIKNGSN